MFEDNKTLGSDTTEVNQLTEQLAALQAKIDTLEQENETLRKSVCQFRTYVENANDLISVLSLVGIFTYVSPSWIDLLGYEVSDVINKKNYEEFIHPDDFPATQAFIKKTIETGEKQAGFEYRALHKNGTWRTHVVNSSPLFNETGQVCGVLAISRDTTDRKAELDLISENQKRLKDAQRIGKIGCWEWSPKDGKVIWSDEMYRIFGVEPGTDLTTETTIQAFHPDDWAKLKESTQIAIETGIPQHVEAKIRKPNGEVGYVHGIGESQLDENGNLLKMVGIYQDITEQKMAEDKIIATEKFYQAIINKAPDGVVLVSLDGRFIYASPSAQRMFGYTDEDIKTTSPNDTTHPDDLPMVLMELNRLISEPGNTPTLQYRFKHKNETWMWVESTFTNLLNEPEVNGIVINFRDITERKTAEELLQESREKYQLLLDTMREGVVYVDNEDTIIYINQSCCDLYGYKPEDLIGKTGYKFLIHEDDRQTILEKNRDRLNGKTDTYEVKGKKLSGEIIWVRINGAPIKDSKGNVIGSVGLMSDITKSKIAEQNLIIQHDISTSLSQITELHSAMQYLLEAVCRIEEIDSGSVYTYDGSTDTLELVAYTGLPDSYIKGYKTIDPKLAAQETIALKSIKDGVVKFLSQADITKYATSQMKYSIEGLRSIAMIPVIYDGNLIAAFNLGSHRFDEFTADTKLALETIASNIGGMIVRIRAEESLKASENRFRSMFNSMIEGFALHEIICNEHGKPIDYRFLMVNPSFETLTGFKAEQLIGKTVLEVLPNTESFWIDRYGKVALTGEAVTFEDYSKELNRTYRVVAFSNKIGQFAVLMNDITERKQLEEQLLATQKMDAVGRLAGGIAHDFNNLLTVILGYSEELYLALESDDKLRQDIEEITKAGRRASNLTRQILTFSRKQVIQPRVLYLNAEIRDLFKMLQRLIGEDVHISLDLDDQLDKVMIDHGQLEQVIMNLVINSREAMPNGGQIIIKTRNISSDDPNVKKLSMHNGDRYVLLEVTDTGCGIDELFIDRVFEPFFTTKKTGKSNGLGLSTVYGVITQAGGQITVDSKVGTGTTVRIILSSMHNAIQADDDGFIETNLTGNGEHILIVEDEDSLCRLLKSKIIKMNYQVEIAYSGVDALTLLRNGYKPDLIITDVIMPGLNGKDLYDKVRFMIPEQKVLFMSGFTDESIVHHGIIDKGIPFIQKPFTTKEVAFQIRKLLTKPTNKTKLSANIMMLDDEEDIRILVQRSCLKKGHTFTGAETLKEALEILSTNSFDVLLIDMKLLGVSGIEALQEIRKAGIKTPAIILTGLVNPDELKQIENLGVISTIEKSSDNSKLIQCIEDLLSK